mgnify:CR=1 FL=1
MLLKSLFLQSFTFITVKLDFYKIVLYNISRGGIRVIKKKIFKSTY